MMHKSSAKKKITLGRRFYLRLRKKQSWDLHFILVVQESLLLIKILKLEKGGKMVDQDRLQQFNIFMFSPFEVVRFCKVFNFKQT